MLLFKEDVLTKILFPVLIYKSIIVFHNTQVRIIRVHRNISIMSLRLPFRYRIRRQAAWHNQTRKLLFLFASALLFRYLCQSMQRCLNRLRTGADVSSSWSNRFTRYYTDIGGMRPSDPCKKTLSSRFLKGKIRLP